MVNGAHAQQGFFVPVHIVVNAAQILAPQDTNLKLQYSGVEATYVIGVMAYLKRVLLIKPMCR
jgi:hypothetical protein